MVSETQKLRILWATDGSDGASSAIPIVRDFLLPVAENVSVLTVAPEPLVTNARPDPALLIGTIPAVRERDLAEAVRISELQATELEAAIPYEAFARWGNPIQVILKEARRKGVDLIVLGAKGQTKLGFLLLGSVTSGVVQHATQPVLVTRPGQRSIRRILVAYDGSPSARQALRFLKRLSRNPKPEVRLVRVVEPYAVPSRTPISYRHRAQVEVRELNERLVRTAARSVDAVVNNLCAMGWRVDGETVTASSPAVELLEAARRYQADSIVVGSRKPSAMRHYLLGSTAEKLVRHADSAVLVVR